MVWTAVEHHRGIGRIRHAPAPSRMAGVGASTNSGRYAAILDSP
jgi:hypothetical protein